MANGRSDPRSGQAIWDAYCDRLKAGGELIAGSWLGDDPLNAAEIHRQLIMDLGLGYMLNMASDPAYPDLVPFLNNVFLNQPNPDDTYVACALDGSGTYRLSGDRGSVHLLTTNLGRGIMGSKELGGGFGEYDLGAMAPHGGTLDIVLSAERPAGYTGDWLHLDPRADYIIIRQRSYRWGEEQDARLALTRLDPVPPRPRLDVAGIEAGLTETIDYTGRLSRQWLAFLDTMRREMTPNTFRFTNFTEWGGVRAQVYWEGYYEFDADEALILETDVPDTVRYWNIQLNDTLFNTIEYLYRQSSLNGHQATLDSDGKFRAVIAIDDPGVANWLDPQDRRVGHLVGRWYESSSRPVPTLTRVRRADLFDHLPADTPRVTPEQRREVIMARVRGGQLRRRW